MPVPARRTLSEKLVGHEFRTPPDVLVAELGNEAGLVGAADLARER